MKARILLALLRKEVIMMRHSPIIPKIIFGMPLMVMLILPLVATLDVKNVNIAVVDSDHTILARRIIEDISAAEALTLSAVCGSHAQAMTEVEDGRVDAVLTIPPHYARDVMSGHGQVYIEANGVNATKGMIGARYVSQSVALTLRQWAVAQGIGIPAPDISIINLYNPTLDFRNYMIPALMVVLLIMICGFLPALNLVSEKEEGTIDAINVTPVSRMAFVLSKLIPFWIVALLVVTVGMIIGRLVYGLAPVGSIALIYTATIIFSLVMSGLGVLIANKSATMLQSIFVMFAIVIIFQLMSGLFTPIGSMPVWARTITYAIPPRYFIEIMRAVYLRGATLADLHTQYLVLTAFAAILCTLSALTYRKRT